jgi:hypothetical protein
MVTDELKKYLLEQCRDWMLPEEIAALGRLGYSEHGEKVARKAALGSADMERMHGFGNPKVNYLVGLDEENLRLTIAQRLLKDPATKSSIIARNVDCGQEHQSKAMAVLRTRLALITQ